MRVPTLLPDTDAWAVRAGSCTADVAVSTPAAHDVGPVCDPMDVSGSAMGIVLVLATANRLSTAADRDATTAGAVIVALLPVAEADARTGVVSRTPDQACSAADQPFDEPSPNVAGAHVPSAATVCTKVETRSEEARVVVRTKVQAAGAVMAPVPCTATVASSTSPARRPEGAVLKVAEVPVPDAGTPFRNAAPLRAGATTGDDAAEVRTGESLSTATTP